MYNLIKDPDELVNLAYNSEFSRKRNELSRRLQQLIREKLLINGNTFSTMRWVDTNPNYDTFAYNQLQAPNETVETS